MTLQARIPAAAERDSHVGRVAGASAAATLSMRLWGLDWSKVLPWSVDGVSIESGTFDDALPFMAEHYPRIFGSEPERFFAEGMTEGKRRFGEEMDVFVFRVEGKTIGVATAHPADWATYYIRTFAILPEYRERGVCNEWTERICAPLREAGCDRWEGECSPANSAMLRMLVRQGCLINGSSNSERWGQMLRFTKFLREEPEQAFRRQFIYVPAFGRNAQPK